MAQGVKLDAKIDEIIHQIIRRRGNITAVAKAFGVSRRTIERRIVRSKKLQEALAEAREERTDYVESKMDTLIDKGYWPAIRFYLEHLGKSRGFYPNLNSLMSNISLETLKEFARKIDPEINVDQVIEKLLEVDNEQKAKR